MRLVCIVDWILAVIILAQEPECHLELFVALWRVRQLYSLGSLVSSGWDPFWGCALCIPIFVRAWDQGLLVLEACSLDGALERHAVDH